LKKGTGQVDNLPEEEKRQEKTHRIEGGVRLSCLEEELKD
jgi:hypothetical protein